MNIRTLTATLAGAALFGLTAAPARTQTAVPGVAPPPADAKCRAGEAQAQGEHGRRADRHGDGYELTQSRSRLAAGGGAPLCKLDNCARRRESRQKDVD